MQFVVTNSFSLLDQNGIKKLRRSISCKFPLLHVVSKLRLATNSTTHISQEIQYQENKGEGERENSNRNLSVQKTEKKTTTTHQTTAQPAHTLQPSHTSPAAHSHSPVPRTHASPRSTSWTGTWRFCHPKYQPLRAVECC